MNIEFKEYDEKQIIEMVVKGIRLDILSQKKYWGTVGEKGHYSDFDKFKNQIAAIEHDKVEPRVVYFEDDVQQIKFYSIPEWASYVAQDHDGKWYAYEEKPKLIKGNTEWFSLGGRTEQVIPVLPSTLREVNY